MAFNLLYPLRRWWPRFAALDKPIDGKHNFFDGRQIFGESTTWPGLLVAVLLGLLFSFVFHAQHGFLAAMLTYAGHATGSFIKRRFNIPDGKYFPVIDHGDYVILTSIVFVWYGYIKASYAVIAILFTLIVHPMVCFVGYKMRIRERPY